MATSQAQTLCGSSFHTCRLSQRAERRCAARTSASFWTVSMASWTASWRLASEIWFAFATASSTARCCADDASIERIDASRLRSAASPTENGPMPASGCAKPARPAAMASTVSGVTCGADGGRLPTAGAACRRIVSPIVMGMSSSRLSSAPCLRRIDAGMLPLAGSATERLCGGAFERKTNEYGGLRRERDAGICEGA
eukprot:2089292-Prymnesium_polylepis.1